MNCNCKVTEIIIGVVILLSLWLPFLNVDIYSWIITLAAIALILHAFRCKNCGTPRQMEVVKKPKKRRK